MSRFERQTVNLRQNCLTKSLSHYYAYVNKAAQVKFYKAFVHKSMNRALLRFSVCSGEALRALKFL